MSDLLTKLKERPEATPTEPPGAQDWADKFFGRPVILNNNEPFVTQVVRMASEELYFEVSTWDPNEEGYEDGPGDLSNDWHTDDCAMNGQFRGTIISNSNIADALGAIIATLADTYDGSLDFDEFKTLMAEDWVGPVSQDERDKLASDNIRQEWQRLSPAARIALLAEWLTEHYSKKTPQPR